MRIDLLTREYPPHVYGGAGVHVAELSQHLRQYANIQVRCFDGPRVEEGVTGYQPASTATSLGSVLSTLGVDLAMADDVQGADIIHSHTWYTNFAGHVGSLLTGAPHVISAHSLEPLRPWKAEQLGGGYAVTQWVERTAYEAAAAVIAVSGGMRADILRVYDMDPDRVRVVHNGVDIQAWQQADLSTNRAQSILARWGIDHTRPSVVFVGRITRQKGLPYLIQAAASLPDDVQIIICAGAPDTVELGHEVSQAVTSLAQRRSGVIWIEEMLPRDELITVLSAATVFACPSIYEPLGIVNLEAMAVGLPVVATATGGIPEVVDDGVTGLLVPIDQVDDGTGTPRDPDQFVHDLGAAIHQVLHDPERAHRMGQAARRRVEEHFSWESIAASTMAVYRDVLGTTLA